MAGNRAIVAALAAGILTTTAILAAAQTGTGSVQFSIDTSPIIFYLTTVNTKYHVLLLRVKNDTAAPLVLSKDQDSIELTFADAEQVRCQGQI